MNSSIISAVHKFAQLNGSLTKKQRLFFNTNNRIFIYIHRLTSVTHVYRRDHEIYHHEI